MKAMAEHCKQLEKKIKELENVLQKFKSKGKCFNCKKLGHYKNEFRAPRKALGNKAGRREPRTGPAEAQSL